MFSDKASHLNQILMGHTKRSIRKIVWTEKQNNAFTELKCHIQKITYRTLSDQNKEYILVTDASKSVIGSILAQRDNMVN